MFNSACFVMVGFHWQSCQSIVHCVKAPCCLPLLAVFLLCRLVESHSQLLCMIESSILVCGGGRSGSEDTHPTACTVYVELREQHLQVTSSLPSCESWGLSTDHEVWKWASLLYLLSHLSCHPACWTLIRSMLKTYISRRSPRCCFFCRWSQIRPSRIYMREREREGVLK